MSLAEEVEEVFPDIDDTDGLAPSDEFEQWKLRELKRIQREVESAYAYVPAWPQWTMLTGSDARRREKRSRRDEHCPRDCA